MQHRRASGWLAVAFGSALVTTGSAGAGDVLTLETALARARDASPTLRAAAAELRAAQGRRTQAGLLPTNPVVSTDLGRHTAPSEEQIDRGVSLAQEIEVGGQRGLRVAGADHDVKRAEYNLAEARRTVEGEVRRALATLVAATRRTRLAADGTTLARRLAETAAKRARAGDLGTLDVRLAEIAVAQAEQARAQAETARDEAENHLAAVIGAEPAEVVVAGNDEGPASLPNASESALVEHALAVRPDLAAAREERAQRESQAALAHRRGWIPNPTLRGFYRQELLNEQIAGGEISVPLPIWNREQGVEIELRAQASRATAEVERLQREVPRQVHLALVRLRAATEAWTRYRDNALPAARSASDLLQHQLEAGYVGVPDLLVQRDRLLQVESAAITTWLEMRDADAGLIEAGGGSLP
jgi:cobalt-zinc-cadmium efflux system outer membrane protein